VIVSVQPAQATESEFSLHLHRYAGRKDKSLVAASESGVPEVCSSSITYVQQSDSHIYLDSNHTPQCRPSAISLHSNPKWQARFTYHHLINPCLLRSPSLQTRKPPSRNTRLTTTSALPRLLVHYFYPKFWLYIPAIRNPTRSTRYCIDCSCSGHKVWKGCHTFLRFRIFST
jgi:hypothetical protein